MKVTAKAARWRISCGEHDERIARMGLEYRVNVKRCARMSSAGNRDERSKWDVTASTSSECLGIARDSPANM